MALDKMQDLVPPFAVNWGDYFQATDPATDPANMVGPGKTWVESDDDETPTAVVGEHIRNLDNSAWIAKPIGSSSSGGDADTLDGLDSTDFVLATAVGASGGVATLDGGGKVPSAQIPAIALVKPVVVADLAARLALTAQAGDVAVQTDTSKSYMLKETGDPTVDADWIELKAPAGSAPSAASFITYGSEAGLSAERVLTDSTDITGDVSVAGQFKLFIANLAIATAKIAARAVTWAKVQAISTGVLLGRTTASSGDVEEITPDATYFTLASGALGLAGNSIPAGKVTTGLKRFAIQITIGDGTNIISTGVKGQIRVPVDCTIVGWTMLEDTDTSTTTTIDTWKDTYANYPPTGADTMWGTKPNLTAGTKNEATGLSIAVTAGDIIRYNVDANNNAKQVSLIFYADRTT